MIEKWLRWFLRPIHRIYFKRKINRIRRRKGDGTTWNEKIPDNRHLASTNQESVTRIAFRILLLLREMTKDLGIDVFLAYGTLLGAVRHKGFIPWDDDIDVFMTQSEFNVLVQNSNHLPKELALVPMGLGFFKLMDTSSIISRDGKRGIAVDIFILRDGRRGSLSFFNVHTLRRLEYQNAAFYPAIPMDFESQQFSIPNQFSKILSDLYGDYTQLPEEQDRTSSHMDYSQIKIRPYGENCVNLRNYL